MQPMNSSQTTTTPIVPPSSNPSNLSATSRTSARKKTKTELQLRAPVPTIPVTPSTASTLSYVAPPLVAPDPASVPVLAYPDHPPPSYEASMAQQYPIAAAQPIVFINDAPEYSAVSEQKWPPSEQHEEHKYASQPSSSIHISSPLPTHALPSAPLVHSPLPVAVPLMADPPTPLSQRLADSATAALLAFQSHPAYRAGHAKATALAAKHIPPEVVDFIQQPSLGKLLRHPQYLLIVYRFYASVRAPFIGLFRGILVNAAKRALWRRKVSEKDMKANADTTNAAINEGLKQAIGRDMNVQLSPEVCRQIIENIDTKQLSEIFGWFSTAPVDAAKVEAK